VLRAAGKSSVADGSGTDFNGANKDAALMEIRKTVSGDTHELLVAGRVDGEGANQLELEILASIRAKAQAIYVNLNQATFLCSAGLRALLQYWRQMKNDKRVLLVTRPSPEVDAVLATAGFKDQIVEKV
jgi:anti-anti-sigma factor